MYRLLRIAIFFTFSISLFGQSSSTITGQVRDPSGAVIPAANITVLAVETGVSYKTTTNAEGYYTIPALPPITYRVTAEYSGFDRKQSADFKLDTTTTARIDLELQPTGSKEVVRVTAMSPAIETENGMVGGTVTKKEIESLPLEGRNSLELALTVAGVAGDIGADEGGIYQTVPSAGSGLTIGGGRQSSSAFLADGSNATSIGNGRATVTFSPDTIQEFRVIASTFSAQYGSSGGGIVSTVAKSGTSEYRGSAFWFQRNPKLAARAFNSPIAPPMRRNEGGITFGGPVRLPKLYNGKQKTFFFFSFEPKRWINAIDNYIRVPTAEERVGDFRNSWTAPGQTRQLLYQQVQCWPSEADCKQLQPLNRATSTTVYPLFSANDPDPTKRGYVIPTAYLDPLVQRLLKDVPMPNMPYDPNGNNYFGSRGVIGSDNRWNLKLDHALSARNRLTGRYTHIPNFSSRYLIDKGNYLLMSYPSDNSATHQFFLSDSHTFSSRMVNEIRVSYTFSDYSSIAPGDISTRNYTKEFGLPNITSWGYPRFTVSTYLQPSLGMGNNQLLGTYLEHQYQIADDLTLTAGRHTFTTGIDWRFQQLNVKAGGLGDACCGNYNFTDTLTQAGRSNLPTGLGGSRMASFLLGVPASVTLRGVLIPYYYRWQVGAAYLQDDFKLKRNLTLNLGLRWQFNTPRAEKNNRQASIDLDNPVPMKDSQNRLTGYTLNYVYAGYNGSRYLEPLHKKNFEPRFGFAWTPDFGWNRSKRMVVRGGYGISHAPVTGRGRTPLPDFGSGSSGSWNYVQWTGTGAAPATQSANPQYLIGVGRNAPTVIADPVVLQMPANGIICAGCTPRDARVPSGDLIAFAKTNDVPYVQTWNLTVETQLTRELVLSLSYIGQKGTHLYSPQFNLNNPDQLQYQDLLDKGGDPLQTVPDPFGRVDASGNIRNTTLQDLMRPYPTLGNIIVAGITNSNSIYHAGTIEVNRRYRNWLGFRVNYTWSKSIDNSSSGDLDNWTNGRFQNVLDLKANRSVSFTDSRHRFNWTMNMQVPVGRGHHLTAGRVLDKFISDWSVNVIGSMYSGTPFAPYLGDANGITGGATRPQVIRPDLVAGVPVINPRWSKSVANDVPYINPEAFARPAFGRIGNAARTLDFVRNPWSQTLNLSVFRDIYPYEKRRSLYLQVRGEFFNVLNHTYFWLNPNSSPNLFSASVPVSRTGTSLAGAVPYLFGKLAADYTAGSREAIMAQYYNQGFGMFQKANNAPGRIVQLALKLYW